LQLEVRPPQVDREVEALAAILHRSFAASQPRSAAEGWVEAAGRESLRVALQGGAVVAGLALLSMEQRFGGRPVKTAAIHAVGVDPPARGRGVARGLMRAVLAEAREHGFPLSTLFASSYALYRGVGYERAGAFFQAEAPLASLTSLRRAKHGEDGLAVRELDERDHDALAALHERTGRRRAGHVTRGPFAWGRLTRSGGDAVLHAWVVTRAEEPVGCVRWRQAPSATKGAPGGAYYDLEVADLIAADAAVVRRILALLADHAALGGAARWPSGPDDPFLLALPERAFALHLTDVWMVRMLDVAAALRARGWPAGVSGELHLDVADDASSESPGRMVLSVADGEASVEPGGEGRLRLDARGLAPLFTGYADPHALRAAGWVDGPDDELDRAAALFAGPLPWLRDRW